MSHGKAFLNRFLVFLLFLVLAFLALWGIGLQIDNPWAQKVGGYANKDFWRDLPGQSNYEAVVIGIGVVALILGLVFIIMNIERRRVGGQIAPASTATGVISVHPGDVAAAVADSFRQLEGVRTSDHRAVDDRGTKVISVTVNAPAETDMNDLAAACRQARRDIRDALPGQDIRPRFIIQLDRVDTSG
ncbi:hypothetical protein [Corynebacterium bovis]|uniref:hypothetical protein n=1 Tax=Corynebacterium bovis TaxID=36808 RepID=UPI000F64CD74|nr:hypothetical protein [Corynebacterium bovis]RRO81906.1 hypothetical protein CXF38_02430 [Corynebacterium bovis]RRO83587.1 hypothetical protein CXF37_04915 [Corynebacterium bovis]RRO83950.1 hypothetical protein CXF36_01500 [Corynebacterium bovis]RRO92264.1 hypothetical protein CXF45_01670 [Corynebacterium bovis]RRO96678.1 hypothetical protein CXF29_01360 [Corynebacterium bovis]